MKFLVKTHEYSKMFTTAKSDDFYNCIDCCMDTINTLLQCIGCYSGGESWGAR